MSLQRPLPRPAAPAVDVPPPLLGREPDALRRWWFAATSVGELLGFLVPAAVGTVAFGLDPALTMLLMMLAGSVEGLVLGAAQSLVLRRELLGFSRLTWALATSGGAALGWLVGMTPSTFYPVWRDWPAAVSVAVGVLLGLALLGSIGVAQWLVLRRHLSRSFVWVPVNAAAWVAGLGAFFALVTPLWHEGLQAGPVVAVGLVGAVAMAILVAAVTTLWVVRVLHRGPDEDTPPRAVPSAEWRALGASTDRFAVFDPCLVEELPAPVARWLRHAISTGAALLTGVELEGRGHLLLRDSWRRLSFRQRSVAKHGFLWAGTVRLGPFRVTGFDRFTHATGEVRWRLLRRVPVADASGADVARSAAGRHAVELFATLPAVALDPAVRWLEVDAQRAVALLWAGEEEQAITVTIDAEGRLVQVELDRWGEPPDAAFGRFRFGARLSEERRFDGYLVPTEVVAGWHIGSDRWGDGVFLRYRLMRCSFH